MNFADFRGEAKPLDALDIPRIGQRIGVGEDEIHAFAEVEASGSGFDSQGRPKMLFEPHVLYRNLSGEERDRAVSEGLAYPSWGEEPYPTDSYPRLMAAMKINATAALLACSWGLGQILGENYRAAGYKSVEEMVSAFMEDEEFHLDSMVSFIIANGIDDDIRAHRWKTVARVYNGPAYAKHGYDVRLAKAYAKWARIPDMPLDGEVLSPSSYPTIRFGEKGFLAKSLQSKLAELGYQVGAQDGHFGSLVRAAVLAFQADNGLKTDGIVGGNTWSILMETARPKQLSGDRQVATMDDLRKAGSGTVKRGDRGQTGLGALLGAAGLGGLAEYADVIFSWSTELSGATGSLSQLNGLVRDNWWLLLGGAALVGIWMLHDMKKSRLADHQSGKNLGR